MLRNSVALKAFSVAVGAVLAFTPIAYADDPADDTNGQQQDDQNKKDKDPGASIAKDILDKAGQAANGPGQQPASGPDRNNGAPRGIGGALMLVNGVVTCVPNGATFRNNERVESYFPPNGDPRC